MCAHVQSTSSILSKKEIISLWSPLLERYIYYRFIVRFPIALDFLFITFTFLLHLLLSWTSSLSISCSAISASTLSNHVFLGLPTGLLPGDNIILNELLPPGYDIRHVDRGRRGGGVALIYKKDISFRNIVTTNEITQFELLDCIIKVNKLSTRVVVVYRPPPSCKNGLRYEDFAVEWASYIEQFVEVQEELLIVGDFNIHVDSSNNESQSFLDILNANGLIQHVKSSTHQKGHILDLVITREHSNLLKRPPVVFISGVSDVKSSSSLDHFAVLCYLNVNRPKTIHKSVTFRALKNIPVPDYRNDV